MTKIITQFTIGDTIEFFDTEGNRRKEIVNIIETQLVNGFGLWVIYGFGDLFNPGYVSEHKILISQRQIDEQQKPGRASKALVAQ
ncbi:MAG TPA: hypothetical protein VJ964_17890 [Balneolaceae bacterium]|nr:hypothetical protein [Balneolaceae bacterium]